MLDATDRKLLAALDRDARTPISRLAKATRVSRDIAAYRVARLEERGVITGYRAYVDVSRLGYSIYRVYFKFHAITKERHEELIARLRTDDNVFWVGETDGFVDLVFGTFHPSGREFKRFYDAIIKEFRPAIRKEYVHEVLSYAYFDRAYLLGARNRRAFVVGGNERAAFDNTDLALLRLLAKDARTPIIVLAQQLGMRSSSVLYRLRALERSGILLGAKADCELRMLGRQFYSIKIRLFDFKRQASLIAHLKSVLIVTNLTEAVGSWDIEVDVEVADDDEYHAFISHTKEHFPEIATIDFFRAVRTHKVISMPAGGEKYKKRAKRTAV